MLNDRLTVQDKVLNKVLEDNKILKDIIVDLETKISHIESDINESDRYNRRNNIEFKEFLIT